MNSTKASVLSHKLYSFTDQPTLKGEEPKELICIFSDWNMPRMNGMDLFLHLKNHSKASRIPFLLLTTESEKGKVVEAISSGVTDYIIKPFNSDVIEGKLRKVLGTRYRVA